MPPTLCLGLDKIRRLSQLNSMVLRIDLCGNGGCSFARYETFSIGSSTDGYRLTVSDFNSSSTLAHVQMLLYHSGKQFSAKDKDQDTYSGNCATKYYGGWWYSEAGSGLGGKGGGNGERRPGWCATCERRWIPDWGAGDEPGHFYLKVESSWVYELEWKRWVFDVGEVVMYVYGWISRSIDRLINKYMYRSIDPGIHG